MLTWDKSEATTRSVCVGGHKNANEKWNELQDERHNPELDVVAHYQSINKSLDTMPWQRIPVSDTI